MIFFGISIFTPNRLNYFAIIAAERVAKQYQVEGDLRGELAPVPTIDNSGRFRSRVKDGYAVL
jgi:hypothetical protein